jgi:mannose/fructose-specific phosphotransferase system component IIA
MTAMNNSTFFWWVTEVKRGSLVTLVAGENLAMLVTLLWRSRERKVLKDL